MTRNTMNQAPRRSNRMALNWTSSSLRASRTAILLFVFAFSVEAAGISIGTDFPSKNVPGLQLIANESWSVVRELFGGDPPVNLPIECYPNPTTPITHLDNWAHPTRIRVGIQLTDQSIAYEQFAFQLGHELGHVMLDPRRTNGFIEVLATALSLEVVDRLTDRFSVPSLFPPNACIARRYICSHRARRGVHDPLSNLKVA